MGSSPSGAVEQVWQTRYCQANVCCMAPEDALSEVLNSTLRPPQGHALQASILLSKFIHASHTDKWLLCDFLTNA